ncbi:MAG TPA: SDR family oxidoreductase [Acidimicrobiales bacterium]|nr:SDR family oxidoreductase [Acidimicrobiales bacterium]
MQKEIGDLLSLDGRRALVTGAATGIGEGVARMLGRAGARVVIADIDAAGGRAAAAALVDDGLDARFVAVDVTDAASSRRAVEQAVELAGGLDILVNNAGSYHESGSILDQSEESWHRSVAVNYHGVFHMSKPAAEHMVARGGGGSIINIASVDGMLPCLGTSYDSAKAAVIHFTRSLALDLAPHAIRVNGVNPGSIPVETLRRMREGELPPLWSEQSRTGLMGPLMRQRGANIPLGRPGTVEEVASVVLFLAGPAAGYVTGHTVTVDGGWTLI